jgi:thioredoxin 1
LYTPHGVNQFVMALPLTKMAIEIARPIPGWKPSTPDVGEKPLEIPRGDFSALVIHFWASWNGVDPLMDDCVQQVADRFSSRVKFASADVDSERGTGLVQQFGVATVPSLLILKSDAKPRMIVGYRDPEKLAADIESRLLPPTSRPWWAIWRRDS